MGAILQNIMKYVGHIKKHMGHTTKYVGHTTKYVSYTTKYVSYTTKYVGHIRKYVCHTTKWLTSKIKSPSQKASAKTALHEKCLHLMLLLPPFRQAIDNGSLATHQREVLKGILYH